VTARIYTDRRGVRYVAAGQPAPATFGRPTTCGACRRTWDDAVITGVTPVPSGRCPFEYWHPQYETLHVVQGYYGGFGWEDLTASTDRREAAADVAAYRTNEPGGLFRLVTRRHPIGGGER